MLGRACAFFFSQTNLKSTYFEDINFSFVILGHVLSFFQGNFLKVPDPQSWHEIVRARERSPHFYTKKMQQRQCVFLTLPYESLLSENEQRPPQWIQGFWLSRLGSCLLTKSLQMLLARVIYCKSSFQAWNTQLCLTENWGEEGEIFPRWFFSCLCTWPIHLSRITLSVDWWNHVTATPPCFYNSPKRRAEWD